MSGRVHELLTCLVLACVLSPAPARQGTDRTVAALLTEPIGDLAEAEHVGQELAALGTGAIGPLVAVLARGGFEPEPEREPEREPEFEEAEGAPRVEPLDPLRREAVLAGLATLSPSAVRAHLGALHRQQPSERLRCAALEAYGRVAAADDLRSMVTLAAPLDPRELIAPSIRAAFAQALEQLLARDDTALQHVPGAFSVAHPALRAALIDGVRGARREGSLHTLERLLGAGPELDLLALSAIADLARDPDVRVEPGLLDTVRRYLADQDARLVLAAARAAGGLRDARAVPELIELLGAPDPNLRAVADAALKPIAGRDFRGDVVRWRAWYEAEVRWWTEARTRVLEGLRSRAAAHNAQALNEVSEHRLFRRELELTLVERLAVEDPLLVSMACSALGRLGSRAGLHELTGLTGHPDPRVADAAREALQRILGGPTGP